MVLELNFKLTVLINCNERGVRFNYHCGMILEEDIAVTNYVILEDNSRYFYTVRPFELRNALGNIVAVLKEFVFIKSPKKSFFYYNITAVFKNCGNVNYFTAPP